MTTKPSILLLLLSLLPAAQAELATVSAEEVSAPRLYRLDGTVEAVNQSTISAQTSGRILEVYVDVDDFVEKDTLVVRLDDSEHKANLANAQARQAAAKASLADAVKNYDRVKELFGRKLASQSELDSSKASLDSARANEEAVGAQVDQATTQLAYTQVKAPYSGLVTKRHMQIGETAQPGQALLSGISLEQMRVTVDVPQSMMPSVRHYQLAKVQLPDEKGWVDPTSIKIFPYAETGSNSFRVRLELPGQSGSIYPGMLVKTAFVVGETLHLVVPYEAVTFRSEVTAVYVLDAKDQPVLRHVRLGQRLPDGRIAILSGLQAGERVALDPAKAAAELISRRAAQ